MKKPVVLLAWLSVPLAAAAGYFGGRAGTTPAGNDAPGSKTARAVTTEKNTPSSAVLNWSRQLEKCSAAELPAAYAEVSGIKDLAVKNTTLRLLCARWAEVDAHGGLAFFSKVQEDLKEWGGRFYLLAEWALRDPEEAYEALRLSGKETAGDMESVGRTLLYENPEKFWRWFQKARVPVPSPRDPDWMPVIDAHFDEFAALAMQGLATESKTGKPEPRSSKVSDLFSMLAASLVAKDADRAIEWAKAIPDTAVRSRALQSALDVLAAKQPEQIVDYISLLKNTQTGYNVFSDGGAHSVVKKAVETMAERDPLAAMEWTAAHQGQLGDAVSGSINAMREGMAAALRDGKVTPEQAFKAVNDLKDDSGIIRLNMLPSIWHGLSAEQLAAAAEWLKGTEVTRSRSVAMAGILGQWDRTDSAGAMAFAARLNDPAMQREAYLQIIGNSTYGSSDTLSERLATAIERIPPEHRGDILYGQMQSNFSDGMTETGTSFEGAPFAATLADLPASESRDRAVAAVAGKWGTADPLAALEWSRQQTDAGVREKSAGAAVEAWAKQDAWGASEWIKEQPPGIERDTAAHHLARVLRTDEPQSAWAWTADIQDPATRLEAQSAVLRKWRDSSATEARAALDAVKDSLPPADRDRLVNTLEGRDTPK